MTANGRPAPDVRLGATADDGIAASIFALVERGAARRPELAREMRGRSALAKVAGGAVRVEGNRALGRRLLQLLAIR